MTDDSQIAAARRSTSPRDPAARYVNRALELLKAGRSVDAARLMQTAVKEHPRSVGALNLLGVLYFQNNNADRAAALFRQAVQYDKSSPELRYHLGVTLIELGEYNEAHVHLLKAAQSRPDEPDIQSQYARSLEMIGQVEEARRRFQALLERYPDHRNSIFGYGELSLRKKDFAEARRVFELAVEKGIGAPQALSRLAEIPGTEGLKDEIDTRLESADLPEPDRTALHYAGGKIALRQKRGDDAFRHFLAAKAPIVQFAQMDRLEARYASMEALFDREFFEARRGSGIDSDVPVFVLGMPRSGTTLVEQILASHPAVAAAGESMKLNSYASILNFFTNEPDSFCNRLGGLSVRELKEIGQGYLTALRRQVTQPKPKIVDKRPHNFELLALIALVVPKATVIHCVRNPLDTCVSCVLNEFGNRRLPFTGDLELLGRQYRAYAQLMAHWDRVLPLTIHHVRYEALVEDPEGEAREMLGWLGLDWDPACLDFYQADRVVRTASRLQVKEPIFASSIGRWREFEEHLEPLKAALGDLARPEAEYSSFISAAG